MSDASGVGVYLRGVLPYFFQSGNNFLLLGNTARLHSFSSDANIKIIDCNVKPFSLKELFFFPSKISRQINKADFFFSPFFNIPANIKIPVYTTIHDIIFPDMPEYVSKIGLAGRMWFFRRAYKKSQKIFTVSEFSKSRIEYHLGKTKPVIVTYSAIQTMFLEYMANVKNRKKTETIIFIGNIKKHKELDCLLDAFLLAKNEGLPHKLIIIGSKEKFRSGDKAILKKINSLDKDSVIFQGFVSDEQLMEYLSKASLLVQPSLYEGFGLPPLEALVLGTHALISDISVFREIYAGFPVTFFKTGDIKDLKEKIIILLLNRPIFSPVLSGELLYKYTFEKTASKILKEFN
jgi:glycosyltransferase involved in cell wall biosynthesis